MDAGFIMILSTLLYLTEYCAAYGATQPEFLINTQNTGNRDIYSNPSDIYLYNENLADHGVSTTAAWDLVFELRACGDSFILLSETANLQGNVMFELVIGCYSNSKFCVNTPNGQILFDGGQVLDCSNFRFFWLKWTVNGDISFGTGDAVGANQVFVRQTGKLLGGLGVRSGFGNSAVWRRIIPVVTTEEMTTSLPTTSATAIFSTPASNCACSCSTSSNTNMDPHDTDEAQPVPYKVDMKTLSSQKRKLTSASDPRKSSMYIGTVGVALISSVILFIVVLDCIPGVRK